MLMHAQLSQASQISPGYFEVEGWGNGRKILVVYTARFLFQLPQNQAAPNQVQFGSRMITSRSCDWIPRSWVSLKMQASG